MKLRVRDLEVHAELRGEGLPVALLHGFGADLGLMERLYEPRFEGRPFRRLYLDLPGMGATPGPPWVESSASVVEVVEGAIAQAFPGERVAVAGFSYGGYLALGLLARRPELLSGLHLLCAVIEGDRERRRTPDPVALVEEEGFSDATPPELRATFAAAMTLRTHALRELALADVAGLQRADHAFLGRLRERGYDLGIVPESLPPFAGPALVVAGRQDAISGFLDGERLQGVLRRGTFATLDRAGHNLHREQPRLFAALVDEWLDRLEEGAGAAA